MRLYIIIYLLPSSGILKAGFSPPGEPCASDPKDIAGLILFGKVTCNKTVQNLWWAAGYNIIAIPLAAGILYKWNIMLSSAAGAVRLKFWKAGKEVNY